MSIFSWVSRLFEREKVTFPYRYVIIDDRLQPHPTIDILVRGDGRIEEFRFLVDSGATITSLPVLFASLLDIKLDRRKKVRIEGIGKDTIIGYRSEIEIKLNKQFYPITCLFVENDFVPLLGRVDVWKYFSIQFDNKKQRIIFEKT